MAKVSATRNELQARKKQIELAEEGMDLLEQKRAALVKELLQVADRVVHEAEELQQAVETARRALAIAEAEAGSEAVRSAAMATRGDLPIEISRTKVMGVTIPEIEEASAHRSFLDRGYFVTGTSASIDEAASAFEDEVEAILEFAESELHLRFLSEEIQTLSRRVNALEHSLVPRLKGERDYIEMALEERARDERFRLKLAKRRLQAKGSRARRE